MCDEYLKWEHTRHSAIFGIKKYKDSVYRGEIDQNDSMRHGRGVMIYSSGRVYEGTWLHDKRDGSGYERFANGNQYIGEYKSGKVHGSGQYVWDTGQDYDGQFEQGLK